MKKIFILIVVCLMAMVANTYAQDTKEIYCCIVGQGRLFSNKVSVTIDFGQHTSFMRNNYGNRITDENGIKVKFNSMVDASNYLAERGWVMINGYPMNSKQGTCYHFFFKKVIPINADYEDYIDIDTRDTTKDNKGTRNADERDGVYF